jgi:Beta-glucan synthesis-associated protein SKN1/KRE6/Sbg1
MPKLMAQSRSHICFSSLIDPMTLEDQLMLQGFDRQDYVLVLSDKFKTPGRMFYPSDDPFWGL